jgi:phosphoglycolate phosphatase
VRPPRLILFDIDGTLLDCGAQTRPLFGAALLETFGTCEGIDAYNMSGRTDPQIVRDVLRSAGLEDSMILGGMAAMRDLYLGRLESALDRTRMNLCPGVEPLLERLSGGRGPTLALLTGNWERGAQIKLGRFNLNRYFAFGAFGSDGIERGELPPIALERAAGHLGERLAPEDALIIGDSIHDVACAKDHGIPVLGVATGKTPAAELEAAGADWVAADLEEAARTLAWMNG